MTNELLNIDWMQFLTSYVNAESMWSTFHMKLLNLIDKYTPVKVSKSKPKPKWLSWSTLKAIKQNY